MPIVLAKGNLFDHYHNFDIVMHAVSCQRAWGKGFALEARNHLKLTYIADLNTKKGSVLKLGRITSAREVNGVIGINLYAMYNFGKQPLNMYRDALYEAIRCVNFAYPSGSICLPRIGSGCASIPWDITEEILTVLMPNREITLFDL